MEEKNKKPTITNTDRFGS